MSGNGNTEDNKIDEPKILVPDDVGSEDKNDLKPREKRLLALLVVPFMTMAYIYFLPTFTLYVPAHKCCDTESNTVKPETLETTTSAMSFSAEWELNNSNISSHETLLYDHQCWRASPTIHNDSISWHKCAHCWEFDISERNTLVSEFNLVCDSAWRRPLLTCLFMIGLFFGSAGSYLSDRFGRQVVLRITYLLSAVFLIILSFTQSYFMYAVARTGSGILYAFTYFTASVLAVESVPETKRHVANLVCSLSFGLGFLVVPLSAYVIRDWRWFIRAGGIAALAYVPLFWWLTPESPAWIKQTNKHKRMLKEQMLVDSPSQRQVEDEKENNGLEESITKLTLYTNSVLRKRIFILFFLWNVVYLSYLTLNLGASSLGGNIYTSCAVAALVDIASYIVTNFMISKLGRRASCMICFLLSGIMCLLTPLIRSVHVAAGIVSSMTGKFFVTTITAFIVMYTGEMFPTLLRSTSLGMTSMSSRLASAAAPFLVFTGEAVNLSIPYYVMGALALIAAGLALLLPETSSSTLPDTVQDAVAMQKKMTQLPQHFICSTSEQDHGDEKTRVTRLKRRSLGQSTCGFLMKIKQANV